MGLFGKDEYVLKTKKGNVLFVEFRKAEGKKRPVIEQTGQDVKLISRLGTKSELEYDIEEKDIQKCTGKKMIIRSVMVDASKTVLSETHEIISVYKKVG